MSFGEDIIGLKTLSAVIFPSLITNNCSVAHAAHNGNVRNFPPYNIWAYGENNVFIEIAVAGFGKDDLKVEKNRNLLIISGNRRENGKLPNQLWVLKEGQTAVEPLTLLKGGISIAPFTLKFDLAPTATVEDVGIVDGMLNIKVSRIDDSPPPVQFEIK